MAIAPMVWIGVGSNEGDRGGYLRMARRRMAEWADPSPVVVAPVYETDPIGPAGQLRYLNTVLGFAWDGPAERLLAYLQRVEQEAGRPPEDQRIHWGSRTLDLDWLCWGDRIVAGPKLTVPHPRMHERAFVLAPLAEVAPKWVHPVLGKTAAQLLAEVGLAGVDVVGMEPWAEDGMVG